MNETCAIILGAIIAGGFTILGMYLGYRLTRNVTLESIRISNFNKAAAVFRSAFTSQLRELRNIPHPEGLQSDFVYNLIQNSIVKHEIASIRFEPYLSSEEITAYSRAWRKYSNPGGIIKKENPDPLLDYYAERKSLEECIH
jgi:hypothetical protein